ncbi:hypothetical protein V499_06295 [Pseudogymnoascus sp. VKM F-103]|nr:hypothetical protein V499_06295 [Pseudogymnoascus sp. VKM F-103]
MCGGIQHEAPIPTFPKLKTLRITHSRLNEKDLEGLLSYCTGLRTFVFEATYPYVSRIDCVQDFGPRDHLSLDNAVKHLSRHRATLKSLHLDLRERGVGYFLSEVNARPPFFHLKDFKALEHLFFNSHGIYGASHSLKTKGNNSERQDPERLSHMNRSEGSIRLPRREFLSVWFRSEAARIAIPKYAASAPPRISFTNVLLGDLTMGKITHQMPQWRGMPGTSAVGDATVIPRAGPPSQPPCGHPMCQKSTDNRTPATFSGHKAAQSKWYVDSKSARAGTKWRLWIPRSPQCLTIHQTNNGQYIPIANLEVRQATADSAAASPQPNCMSGGSIAGIVIGCIAGTLFFVWLWSALRRNTTDEGYKHGAVATSSRPYDGRRRRRRHSSAGGRPVDRGQYCPGHASAYADSPQAIGWRATISAPHMHASALESLFPSTRSAVTGYPADRPMRVLDVGSGSGYLTHVMAELAGEDGKVVGIEHIKELAELGRENMEKSAEGAAMLESGRVRFVVGDGRKGWVEPDIGKKNIGQDTWDEKGWDAIHVGAGAAHLHEELVAQLRRPGRMFIPVDDATTGIGQHIWLVDKDVNGAVKKKQMYGVSYVPLTDPNLL